ncbi:MarR family transcriptional regulator [Candidatus Pacearchaeota archaeon]|nr:MarR family transcriptional regulator [Candidatus Pacearchaeota archaeon]
MENKQVGFLILGIAVLLIVIIFLFQGALREIVAVGCGIEHSLVCPMNETIDQQTYLALVIVGVLIIFSGVLIFTKPKERIVIRKIKDKKKKLDLSKLDKKEKEVIRILEEENGTIFQAELMEKLGVGKVGITRLLDKLEAKQLIERKRRGMNNVVVLRD